IREQREGLTLCHPRNESLQHLVFVIVVKTLERPPDIIAIQQDRRLAGVLCQDLVDAIECLYGAIGDISEVSDRSRHEVQRSLLPLFHFTCLSMASASLWSFAVTT